MRNKIKLGLIVAVLAGTYFYLNTKDKKEVNQSINVGTAVAQAEYKNNITPVNNGANIAEVTANKMLEAVPPKYLALENELIEAKLLTGAEYFINQNQKSEFVPVLLNFKYKDIECTAFAQMEPRVDKSGISLTHAKCGNDELKVEGYFFDANKSLGAVTTFNPDNQKYMVPLQEGFIVLKDASSSIHEASKGIEKFQLLNAEIKTGTLSTSGDNLPVLVSFVSNGTICNSIGDISSLNDVSSIRLLDIKCADQKYKDVRGWFFSSNKMINVNEEIVDIDTKRKIIPMQSGFVLVNNY